MPRLFAIGAVVIVITSVEFSPAAEENWPQWRGPRGTGVAADGEYPVKFSNNEGVAWKVKLPGTGSSTPAVWGNQVFVTCQIDGRDSIVCYDMKGQEQWQRKFGPGREGKKARVGTGSNPSPVTDGKHVIAYFKSGTIACLDVGGRELWKHNLQEQYGEDTLWWDLGTSPVLVGGRAIVAVMHEGPSYLVAFDLESGEVAWKQEREYDNEPESDQAYTTPQVVRQNGKDVIVTWGADHLTGHDASSGKLLWQSGGFNPENKGMWRVIASAPIEDGVAIVPYGRGEFVAGVRVGGDGDVTKSNRVWEKRGRGLGSDVPTPVVANGRAYLLSDTGRVSCRDMRTGEEIWAFDLPRNRNKYYASPVLAGDKLYCTREDGTIFVGRVSDDGYEELEENKMGEWVIATPVPIRGGLLIRGETHLFWIAPDQRTARRDR
jgi:outer membrane protein assembly factor BamB